MKDRLALSGIGVLSSLVILGVGFLLLGRRADTSPGYDVSILPTLNAFLNGSSALLLTVGYFCIRRKKVTAHKILMATAFLLSSCFLVSYVIYHYQAGSILFSGRGWIRPVYFTLLISHILLAASIVPLALVTLYRAWKEDFERHKRIARFTLPVWLYVSVTGVVVYWMLYWLSPR
jgi:putative membrane protein